MSDDAPPVQPATIAQGQQNGEMNGERIEPIPGYTPDPQVSEVNLDQIELILPNAPVPQSSEAEPGRIEQIPDDVSVPEINDVDTDRIERVLADFRAWLTETPPPPEEPATDETVDLYTLIAQFTALRHEVNLQTKSARSTLEQNAALLDRLGETLELVRGKVESSSKPDGIDIAPLLKSIVDVYDSLALALREATEQRDGLLAVLESGLPADSAPAPVSRGLLGWFSRARPAVAVPEHSKGQPAKWQEARGFVQQALDALLAGYKMSLNRIDRVLPKYELEPMACVGEPFDPERMEAVEVVSSPQHTPGTVLEEVRRGYIWRGKLFRYAQVKVSRG